MYFLIKVEIIIQSDRLICVKITKILYTMFTHISFIKYCTIILPTRIQVPLLIHLLV